MRITFLISHADLSGGMRVIATYAQRLQARGHQVLIVSRPKRRATLKEWVNHHVLKKPLPWDARPVTASHLDDSGVPHRMIGSHRPIVAGDLPDADVVVATWWETLEWAWPLPRAKGAKVQFMQDYETFGGAKERVDATCRLPVPRIVIAQWVKDLLANQFGQTDAALVPNAVDQALFHAPPREKGTVPVIGTTYTRFRNKGTDLALEAYKLAKAQVPELKLVMFGGGAVDPSLPIPDGAEFFHRLPDDQLRNVYSRCDAWLFATRIEAFGLPILEAMACRTPVIGFPAGAAPELIGDGGGLLVPAGDVRAMADAIVKVARMDPAAWKAMSDAAFATASRCGWDQAVDRFEAVLAEAATTLA
jgi:glycosyltransferase involved in cell wall biosynthesis